MQDLVLMACGTLDGAMAFCRANGVSISSVPVPGQEYIVPADIEFDEVVLTDLWQKGIEIGTLYEVPDPDPSSHFNVILYPMMRAALLLDMLPEHILKLSAQAGFIHANSLPDAWSAANYLKHQFKYEYEADGGISAPGIVPYTTLQSDKETLYHIGFGLIVEQVMMWWSDLTEGIYDVTAQYEDVAGYRAFCAPLVLLTTFGTPIVRTLIGKLDVEFDHMEGSTVYIRLTPSHSSTGVADFNVASQQLLIKSGPLWVPLTGTPIGSSVVVAFPFGVHEIALRTNYINDAADIQWPSSMISMVIQFS